LSKSSELHRSVLVALVKSQPQVNSAVNRCSRLRLLQQLLLSLVSVTAFPDEVWEPLGRYLVVIAALRVFSFLQVLSFDFFVLSCAQRAPMRVLRVGE